MTHIRIPTREACAEAMARLLVRVIIVSFSMFQKFIALCGVASGWIKMHNHFPVAIVSRLEIRSEVAVADVPAPPGV